MTLLIPQMPRQPLPPRGAVVLSLGQPEAGACRLGE